MGGRTPSEAVQAFVAPLQQSLSCVADAVLTVGGGYYPSQRPHAVTIAGGEAVRLSGKLRLGLQGAILYRIVEAPGDRGPWRVSTLAYQYALDDLHSGQEIVGYHWDPSGDSPVVTPHLHVNCSQENFPLTRKQHLPTGHVTLEEFLRFAITELSVKPRRRNWSAILDRNQRAFEER